MTNPMLIFLLQKIESVQYNAALAITGAIRGTSRERIYQELGLEHLSQRRWYRRLCMFWKIVNYLNFPAYLKGYLPRMQFSHNENRSKLFATMHSNTNYFKN